MFIRHSRLVCAFLFLTLAVCAGTRAAPADSSADPVAVKGAGASFPSKVYAQWAKSYQGLRGVGVDYRPTGSGDGIKQATARAVDFGGTDSPLNSEELAKRHLIQIPMLVGGLVPVVNLPGVGAQKLRLTGERLAEIMMGSIERWDDPRIRELNPGLPLPALRIQRIVRADKSGSTEGFTAYLSQLSPAFKAAVGSSQSPQWPGPPLAGDGNDGLVRLLAVTPGAITYVSYDRVVRDKLAAVMLRNADGQWVAASENGFVSAIRASDLHRKGDDQASLLQRPGPGSWPITLTSFVLVDALPQAAASTERTLRFIYWCFMNGDELTRGTGFAPLPITTQAKIVNRMSKVKARDGGVISFASF